MLDLLLKVASMTRGQDIHYVVVGEGPLASEFRRAARQISGASLTVAPRVPRNIALLYVRSSDLTWSVYQQRPESLNERTALGWKLFESLACGVPVIVNANTLSAQLVKRFKCGLVFEGNNPDEMVQLILGLSANTNQFLEMSRKAMHTSTTMNFNWETMGSKLLATYRRIALS
jgi:glycosyltransferase involved in cell wall biosynthesis